jgi:amino acid adenylation domain-containing protein
VQTSAVPVPEGAPASGPDPLGESGGDETFAFPLSFSQQRLWFLDQLDPGTALYNIPINLRLTGPLEVAVLRSALSEIVRRHEALRTVFRTIGEEPRQVVLPAREVPLPVVDLSALPGDARTAAMQEAADEDARRPYDLAAGPLFRARLLRMDAEEHALLLGMHHIVSDGWSVGVLKRELRVLYEAFAEGLPSPLPELPLQYGDVAVWQRDNLAGEVMEGQVGYWREQLRGAPAVLDLPTDLPRPPVQTYSGDSVGFTLPAPLIERVRALGRANDATLFMTLSAALSVLLHRWSGQRDLTLGSPIAGRTYSELEELVGFFVNTLVLRVSLDGDPTFQQLLARVRETTLDAYGHQDVPFERLVEELQPQRDLSRPPLFQVMFMMQNMSNEDGTAGKVRMDTFSSNVSQAKFELTVVVVDAPDGFRGIFQYNTDLFQRPTIERMSAQLTTLLEAASADPGARVSRLPLLPAAERALVLETWNRVEPPVWTGAGMHGGFQARAAATPDAVALEWEGGRSTYAELDAAAGRLAHRLRAAGVGPESLVALCVERGPRMVEAVLAVLRAGGAYLPLDPAYPRERLAYMLEDSGARVLLGDGAAVDALARPGVEVIAQDREAAEIAALPAAPARPPHPEAAAYVIYTSGSTGRPKGVVVRHAAVENFLRAMARRPGLPEGAGLLAVTTLSFDIAVLELMLPLTLGGRVVLAGRETAADPAALRELFRTSGATAMQATPATWRMLADAGWTPPSGALLMSGGEPLPRELAERLLAGGATLWNLYGPTETTIWSSAARVLPGGGPVPIGGPIDATSFHVLSPEGEPVPLGAYGELHVGGEGLARGYLRRPSLTALRFLPDPFSATGGARMYATGDRVRWRADGTLEIGGRLDTQVKLRGFRIELGEIEALLRAHPAVREAVAVVREDVAGDPRLVAYVVAGPGAEAPDGTALRAVLRERLPEYMVPSGFVLLESLPLTPNGKVDRGALPAPGVEAAPDFEEPAAGTEAAVAEIWAAILRLPRVGATDNFFELGGHSLLATQVVARIRTEIGVSLPVLALFEAPTVREMAVRADAEKARGPGMRSIGAVSRDRYRIQVANP